MKTLKQQLKEKADGYCKFNVNRNSPKGVNKCVNAKCSKTGENCIFPVILLSDTELVFRKWLTQKRQNLIEKPIRRTYTRECYLHVYNELLRELQQ